FDCNNSWDWEADFAFNNPFTTAASWNVYAQIIWDHSNSYGFPFSDLLGKPLVQINNAAILLVTILDDDATNDNYTPPTPAPTPDNQKPDVTNPTTGNKSISVIFDGGVGSNNPYTGTVIFGGKTFSFGFGTLWSSGKVLNNQAAGNCSIFQVPSNTSQTIRYSFSFDGKPFNLYTKIDGSGKITAALVDGGLEISISMDFTSVTISKIQEHVKPPATIETMLDPKRRIILFRLGEHAST
ncbi:MAG: hypothetical protein H7246_12760, partial [Phycisphaerae bacterium]|nr:hypothetical protein [Saprospiraceae bacterium]